MAVVTLAALGSLGHHAPTGAAALQPCVARGTTTVLQTNAARLFYKRDDPDKTLFGCAFSRGTVVAIDDPGSGFVSFRRPALALRGAMVGYAVDTADEENRPGGTNVGVVNLRSARANVDDVVSAPAGPQEFARVGSLVVRTSGAIAWISCPYSEYGMGQRGPTCLRAGHTDSVYRINARRKHPTLLARGKAIDPQSLRLVGRYVYWTSSGRRHRALLR